MSFGAIADEYNRLRPDPPDRAVDWLLHAGRDQVVDLAAGTGKLSRALAQRAGRVIAIEPDSRMSAVLRSRSPGIAVASGLGEAIPLRAESADGLFISSAWHWMNPEQAVPEIGRVLRNGGTFGLIWTGRDREVDWVRALDQMREGQSAGQPEQGRDADRRSAAAVVESYRRRNRDVPLPPQHPFTDIESTSFTYARTMPVEDVISQLGTYSRILVASPEDRATTMARLRGVLEQQFPGATEIDLPIRAMCWRATRIAR
jgi:SAM-dependent methyltransferase